MKDEVFCATTHIKDFLTPDLFRKLFGGWRGERARPAQVGGENGPSDQFWF